jgi:hypothetical protein
MWCGWCRKWPAAKHADTPCSMMFIQSDCTAWRAGGQHTAIPPQQWRHTTCQALLLPAYPGAPGDGCSCPPSDCHLPTFASQEETIAREDEQQQDQPAGKTELAARGGSGRAHSSASKGCRSSHMPRTCSRPSSSTGSSSTGRSYGRCSTSRAAACRHAAVHF